MAQYSIYQAFNTQNQTARNYRVPTYFLPALDPLEITAINVYHNSTVPYYYIYIIIFLNDGTQLAFTLNNENNFSQIQQNYVMYRNPNNQNSFVIGKEI